MVPIYSIKKEFLLDQGEELKPDMYRFSFVWLKGQHIPHTRERAGGGEKRQITNKCL